MPSFGYTSSGSGTGSNDAIYYWDLAGSYPHTRFYPYTNNSGSPVLVNTATLYNVVGVGAFNAYKVLVYDSINEFGGLPERLIGVSDVLTSITTGNNNFNFTTTFLVDSNTRIWVALVANLNSGSSTSLSVSGAQRSISETVEWGIQKENWGYVANSPFPGTTGWIRTNIAVPIDLSGTVGTPPSPTNIRESLYVHEPVSEGVPNVREPLYVHEPVAEGVPNVRESLYLHEPLAEGVPNVRCPLFVLETLQPVEPEPFMATAILPALQGLTFIVTKSPSFSTRKPRSVNGRTVRNALMQYPIWKFKFSYDYLPDKPVSVGETDLKNLVGFFLQRQGSFDEWLYLDPDDNQTTSSVIATGDGVTLQWPLVRSFGGFYEPVGQYNSGPGAITVHYTDPEAATVPVTPGPYTVTVAHAATFEADMGVTIAAVPLTKVTGSPGNMQYAVTAGVYTFNSAQQGAAAVITYRYTASAADYSITLPNQLVFGVAPIVGRIITADFHYYYRVIFSEDSYDFEKFMDKLWQLQEMTFESVP